MLKIIVKLTFIWYNLDKKEYSSMRAFIFGSTGLIGYHSAMELIARGHEVYSIGLTSLPSNTPFVKKTHYVQDNIEEMSDTEIIKLISGADWVLYACSTNAIEIVKAPADEYYKVHNVLTTERILRLAQEAKVKKVVLISNAYEYFNVNMATLRLEKWHPYIRATLEQENVARRFNTTSFQVVILEAPQIWGVMPKRKPLHYDSIMEMYRSNDFSVFKGTIPVITIKQLAQAVCGAFENLNRGQTIPIAGDNFSYKKINEIIMKALNMKPHVTNVNKLKYKIYENRRKKVLAKQGLEAGIDPIKIIEFKEQNAYIDPKIAKKMLGMQEDDIEKEIADTTRHIIEYAHLHKQI